jgi:N-acetyl-anhydromuramyl-L-alanine amidase AmpD
MKRHSLQNYLILMLAFFALMQLGMAPIPAPVQPAFSLSEKLALTEIFQETARTYGIPVELLMAIGYLESRWDQRNGEPSIDSAYGIMGLRERTDLDTLGQAAKLLGVSRETLKTDPVANIEGAAALLRQYADETQLTGDGRLESWTQAIRQYSGMKDEAGAIYLAEIYAAIGRGVNDAGIVFGPVSVDMTPYNEALETLYGISAIQAEYPKADWAAACSTNYTSSSRPSSYPIQYIVIHVAQGSYAGTIGWFQNCSSKVSAHYVMRSSDGASTQMVLHKDIGWHAGNWDYNTWSIGIEHEGYVENCNYFTDTMYKASADLVRYLCDLYGIPKDRNHIIGHIEVPGATHTDPGPCWNWSYYMQLVNEQTESPKASVNFSSYPDMITKDRDFNLAVHYTTNLYQFSKVGKLIVDAKDIATGEILASQVFDNDGKGLQGPENTIQFTFNIKQAAAQVYFLTYFTYLDGDYNNRLSAAGTSDDPTGMLYATVDFSAYPSSVLLSQPFTVSVHYTTDFYLFSQAGKLLVEMRELGTNRVLDTITFDNDGKGLQGPENSIDFEFTLSEQVSQIYFLSYFTPQSGGYDERLAEASTQTDATHLSNGGIFCGMTATSRQSGLAGWSFLTLILLGLLIRRRA